MTKEPHAVNGQLSVTRKLALVIGISLAGSVLLAPSAGALGPVRVIDSSGWSVADDTQGGDSPIPLGPEEQGQPVSGDDELTAADFTTEAVDLFPNEADPGEAYAAEVEPVEVAPEPSPYVPADVGCVAGSGAQQICVERGPAVLPSDNIDGVQPESIQALPPACFKYVDKGWVAVSRTQICEISGLTVTVSRLVDGVWVPTGVANFNVFNYAYTDTSGATWANQIQFGAYSMTGTAIGLKVSGTASCKGACKLVSSSFPIRVATTTNYVPGESKHKTTVTKTGQIGYGKTTWSLVFQPADPNTTPAITSYTTLNVRCDKAVPGLSTLGCVVPQYTPAIVYKAAIYPELVRHIKAAQGSGLPGAYPSGTPLTRLTGSAKIKANRKRACPDSLDRPTGASCDEYPFASTNQGAVSGGGSARTFSWCHVPGASHTGASGYSRCMIDEDQNSLAGTDLGKFLKSQRIISGNAYRVALR